MLGSNGPRVTLQTPCSSLLNLGGGVAPSQSPVSVTSEALGAKIRKVTWWSDETSGDCSVSLTVGSRRGACADATVEHTTASKNDRYISVPPEKLSERTQRVRAATPSTHARPASDTTHSGCCAASNCRRDRAVRSSADLRYRSSETIVLASR